MDLRKGLHASTDTTLGLPLALLVFGKHSQMISVPLCSSGHSLSFRLIAWFKSPPSFNPLSQWTPQTLSSSTYTGPALGMLGIPKKETKKKENLSFSQILEVSLRIGYTSLVARNQTEEVRQHRRNRRIIQVVTVSSSAFRHPRWFSLSLPVASACAQQNLWQASCSTRHSQLIGLAKSSP